MNITESGAATKTTRRNGQLMSCEPCRRSKQRCDHGWPHCMRCRKRGKTAEAKCHYHPAPMTRGARLMTPLEYSARSSKTSESRGESVEQAQIARPSPIHDQQGILDRGVSYVSMDDPLPPLLQLPANENSQKRTYTAITRAGVVSPAFTASPDLIAEGISILQTARDSPVALGGTIRYWSFETGESPCQGPLVKASWQAVEETLLPLLRNDSSPAATSQLCEKTFKCTSQPLRWPLSPADGALVQALSNDGVRWECVGLYFALSGVMLAPLEGDPEDVCFAAEKWGPTRKRAMERTLDVSIQCYRICEQMGQINDLTMWLLLVAAMLSTWCYGDDSYLAFRLMGDISSVVGALGFHRAAHDEIEPPYYLQELRKRAMVSAHEYDKGQATFVGRPPRLNRNYLGPGPPLDLPDHVVLGTPENFATAVANLDKDGWSKDGLVHAITRSRAMMPLVKVREEALELSLGSQGIDIESRARDLLSTSAETWASLPHHVRFEPSMWATKSLRQTMMTLMIRLESLYTDFILLKLIVNQDHSHRDTLIKTSHTIMSLLLSALNQRISLARHRIDLEWSMIYYAIPCASILILELLRQSEQPHQPMAISRSTLIQDLSVLISCCDWLTEPDQQNYKLCKRAQSIFSRSLDRILNPAAAPIAAVPAEQGQQLHVQQEYRGDTASVPELSGPVANQDGTQQQQQQQQQMLIDEPEWMAWLETCDLQADPWLDILAESSAQGYQNGL